MQSKALLSLLLLAPAALASPVAQSDDYYSEYANADDYEDLATLSPEDLYSSEIAFIQTAVPTSILTVLETAIPSTWIEALADPSAQYSIYEAAASGVYPDWYSSLPQSVKAWVTGDDSDSETGIASLLPTMSSDAASSGSTAATTTGPSSADATSTSGSSSSAAASSSSSDSTSDASSSSATPSGSPSPSSTGNGAMPMATGGVAASVAGVVGLLGLAVAL